MGANTGITAEGHTMEDITWKVSYIDPWTGSREYRLFASFAEARKYIADYSAAQGRTPTGIRYSA
jgi:hypothetical protein